MGSGNIDSCLFAAGQRCNDFYEPFNKVCLRKSLPCVCVYVGQCVCCAWSTQPSTNRTFTSSFIFLSFKNMLWRHQGLTYCKVKDVFKSMGTYILKHIYVIYIHTYLYRYIFVCRCMNIPLERRTTVHGRMFFFLTSFKDYVSLL